MDDDDDDDDDDDVSVLVMTDVLKRSMVAMALFSRMLNTSISALAIRPTSALNARVALRVSLISISPPRSSKSLKKLYHSVTFI